MSEQVRRDLIKQMLKPLLLPGNQRQARGQDWVDAVHYSEESGWKNFKQDRQNDISEILSKNCPREFQNWNTVAGNYSGIILEAISRIEIDVSLVILKKIRNSIAWDWLSYCIEDHFHEHHRSFFFREIADAYADGKYPFGWVGAYPLGGVIYLKI